MKVVVVLPTYNERENIIPMLDALEQSVSKITAYKFAILVVDDTSPDGTAELVGEYQKKHKSVYLLTGKKEGLGKALLRGMTYAISEMGADIISQMDADLSHDPAVLSKFFTKLDSGADFVIGSRYIPGGSIPDNWGLHRKIYSVLGNSFVRFGLGFLQVHDWTGGYRVFRQQYFEKVKNELIAYSGYVFQIAFLHKAILAGAKIAEVPIKFTDRRFGHSKIATSEYIKNIFLYVGSARYKQLTGGSFGKFVVVGTIGFIINTVILELAVRAGLTPTLGSAAGAELAIVSNFILNNAWTFNDRKIQGSKLAKFLQFNLTSLGAVVIQSGTVFVGTSFLGASFYRWFYVLGVGFGLIWNYWMYSKVIWKRS